MIEETFINNENNKINDISIIKNINNDINKDDINYIDIKRLKNNEDIISFQCVLCNGILINPKICVECQNNFCFECKKIDIDKNNTCACNEVKYRDTHKIHLKELNKLLIECINKDKGCLANILYEKVNEHEKTCDFKEIKCTNDGCNEKFLFKDWNNHTNICEYKLEACKYCRIITSIKEINIHQEICDLKEINCTGCKVDFILKDYRIHEEICEDIVIKCKRCEIEYKKKQFSLHDDYNCALNKFNQMKEIIESDYNKIHNTIQFFEEQLNEQKKYFSIICNDCNKFACEASTRFCQKCDTVYCINCIKNKLSKCKKCELDYCFKCKEIEIEDCLFC